MVYSRANTVIRLCVGVSVLPEHVLYAGTVVAHGFSSFIIRTLAFPLDKSFHLILYPVRSSSIWVHVHLCAGV
jgi:hypothetical protein